MLFTKPKNLKYTDLCIWIDANAYKSDCDDEKLYEYLFLITNAFFLIVNILYNRILKKLVRLYIPYLI